MERTCGDGPEARADRATRRDPLPPDAQEQRLRARFDARVEVFAHGALMLEILLPRSADALIDESAFADDERLPYWAELWPSARALARHLLEAPAPAGTVLELGCGLALPSLALHARGTDVLATDYYADALRFAEVNSTRNRLPPLPTALLDWRRIPPGFERRDLLLVSDAFYERRNADALAEALPRLVAPGGRALVADPGRVHLGDFLRAAPSAGWRVAELPAREEISDPRSGAFSRVRLLELRRGRSG